MSLQKQQDAFRKSMGSAYSTERATAKAPSSAPVSSSSSSTTSALASKRKRPIQTSKPSGPPIVYSQPTDTSLMGQSLMTQVVYVVNHLKAKEAPLTPAQIGGDLTIRMTPELLRVLKDSPRLVYSPANNTFEFRPLHNIRSAEGLLAFLQNQTTAQGLAVKDLKDGWAGAQDTINQLEADRDILVTRTKKDNQPRHVWINDKSLDVDVDNEFQDIWHKIKIPVNAELPGELEKLGLKPTSVDPSTLKRETKPSGQKGRKRANNRRMKVTNTHMQGILKNYSK